LHAGAARRAGVRGVAGFTMSPDHDEKRLLALLGYGVLDTPGEAAYDDITELAARFFDVPIALVSLVDRDRQWFKSRVGMAASQTPRDIAFCNAAIEGTDVMVVRDAQLDPRFADNPLVTGAPGIRFYAGAPLVTSDGYALGTLCVIDREARSFSNAEHEALVVLSRQIVTQLELRKRNAELAAALSEDRERRLLADATVRKSEQRLGLLEAVVQRLPGLIYQFRRDPDGHCCLPFASAGLSAIFELTPEQVRDDAGVVFALLHPDDYHGVVQSIAASAATLQAWSADFRVILPRQGLRWRQGNAQPERLADGSVLWHGFITDITERKQDEANTQRLALA